MKALPTNWLIGISLTGGIAIGMLLVVLFDGHLSFDPKIRVGEIATWIITITLYLGTPILLKRYVDDEREVKKLVNEEINQIVKESEVINSALRNSLNVKVSPIVKDNVLISFEILEKNVGSIGGLVKNCIEDWDSTKIELQYFKYKDAVTSQITKPDFEVENDFYNRQLLDLKGFQDELKDIKVKVMRS